ncbi:Asp-tRNA(Asn)/Glu-tRNA(Gln) amidotransferase subunit GatB, partial [Patescibacteria group bacterium]
ELKTKTKMFCSSLNDPDERQPNINICPVCMGHPGTLPVINKEAVRKVVKTGLALNSKTQEHSKFDRKNYFYPDLPKGYQISQYDQPICLGGYLKVGQREIKITRVHLEEDTGRLIHPQGQKYSLVDFNRAGIPLMELVTEPDLRSAQETREFAEELRLILRYLGVSDADMEKGQMRIEANISLTEADPESKIDYSKLGTKVEVKNLNSFRAVEKAIEYEIERQAKILRVGKKIIHETRGWNENKGTTVSQREKEHAHDYRYFPEPDLPPLNFTKEFVQEIRAEVPELPQKRRERFKKEYELGPKEIEVFVQNKDLGEYFEKVVSELGPNITHEELLKLTKLNSNYLITDLQGTIKVNGIQISDESFLITPENFAEFINLIYQGRISSKTAKEILKEMLVTGADPSHIIEEKGLTQITDENKIEEIVKEVILKNEKAVKDYRDGKETSIQFLVGQAMAQSRGKANPKIVTELLKKNL